MAQDRERQPAYSDIIHAPLRGAPRVRPNSAYIVLNGGHA
jgi:hypothetical protein